MQTRETQQAARDYIALLEERGREGQLASIQWLANAYETSDRRSETFWGHAVITTSHYGSECLVVFFDQEEGFAKYVDCLFLVDDGAKIRPFYPASYNEAGRFVILFPIDPVGDVKAPPLLWVPKRAYSAVLSH